MSSRVTLPLPLSDDEVLSLTDLELPKDQDERLSQLLHLQQSGRLTETDRRDLSALMQRYQEGLFRKALGWREAVRRGLREPPLP